MCKLIHSFDKTPHRCCRVDRSQLCHRSYRLCICRQLTDLRQLSNKWCQTRYSMPLPAVSSSRCTCALRKYCRKNRSMQRSKTKPKRASDPFRREGKCQCCQGDALVDLELFN